MKRILLTLLALLLCLTTCLSFFACKKDNDGDDGENDPAAAAWAAAFAFENVRVDCTKQYVGEDPVATDPLYSGSHYLLTADQAAIENVPRNVIVNGAMTEIYEILYRDRADLLRLFNFGSLYKEFTKKDDNTYFCETSSLKGIIKTTDHIENVYVTFADGRVSKITYNYFRSGAGANQIFTFTFSQYGQVQLEQPTP